MFSNCIERLGHKNNKKLKTKQQTNKQKPRNKKMGIIAPTMNHYPRNG